MAPCSDDDIFYVRMYARTCIVQVPMSDSRILVTPMELVLYCTVTFVSYVRVSSRPSLYTGTH